METRKIKEKLVKLILLVMTLSLVIPLSSFAEAEEEKIPIKLIFQNEEESFDSLTFDYWKMEDDIPNDNMEKIELASKYENTSKDDLDKLFGESKKSPEIVRQSDEISSLTLENLSDGLYLFKLDDSSYQKLKNYTVPAFFLQVDPSLKDQIIPKVREISISLNKIDKDDKKFLQGVEFELYQKGEEEDKKLSFIREDSFYKLSESGESILVTDGKGQIIVKGLDRNQKYYFKETKPLPAYLPLDEKSKDLTVGESITVENEKDKENKSKIKFIKVDRDDKKKYLSGAEFLLSKFDEEKESYESLKDGDGDYILVSDKNGEFITKDLPFGKYQLTEIKAPKGYVKTNEPIEFLIDENTETDKTIEVRFIPNEREEIPKDKEKPKKPSKGSMVKTGDIKIFLFVGFGLLLILIGVKLLVNKEKID